MISDSGILPIKGNENLLKKSGVPNIGGENAMKCSRNQSRVQSGKRDSSTNAKLSSLQLVILLFMHYHYYLSFIKSK